MTYNDENGQTGALRVLKMAAENPTNAPSILDSIKDACMVDNKYNYDFLATIASFAIEGWKNA